VGVVAGVVVPGGVDPGAVSVGGATVPGLAGTPVLRKLERPCYRYPSGSTAAPLTRISKCR
jgi:hypothetical protein